MYILGFWAESEILNIFWPPAQPQWPKSKLSVPDQVAHSRLDQDLKILSNPGGCASARQITDFLRPQASAGSAGQLVITRTSRTCEGDWP